MKCKSQLVTSLSYWPNIYIIITRLCVVIWKATAGYLVPGSWDKKHLTTVAIISAEDNAKATERTVNSLATSGEVLIALCKCLNQMVINTETHN